MYQFFSFPLPIRKVLDVFYESTFGFLLPVLQKFVSFLSNNIFQFFSISFAKDLEIVC